MRADRSSSELTNLIIYFSGHWAINVVSWGLEPRCFRTGEIMISCVNSMKKGVGEMGPGLVALHMKDIKRQAVLYRSYPALW